MITIQTKQNIKEKQEVFIVKFGLARAEHELSKVACLVNLAILMTW